VGDLAGNADFAAEAVDGFGVLSEGFGEEFEGDGLSEGEVFGAIDLAHTATSEERDHAVAVAEKGSGDEAGARGGGRSVSSGGGRMDDDGLSVLVRGRSDRERLAAIGAESRGGLEPGVTGWAGPRHGRCL